MRVGRGLGLMATATVVLGVWCGAPAGAAVVSGSNLVALPGNVTCNGGAIPISCTATVSTLPVSSQAPGGATAAIDGVIVSWSIRTGDSASSSRIRLRVVRGTTGAGVGPHETLPAAAGVYSYAARMPVEAGDQIGIDLVNVSSVPVLSNVAGATMDFWFPLLGESETRAPTSDELAGLELLMNATIEPDADGDGFGDETQDGCAGTAGADGGCQPSSPSPSQSSQAPQPAPIPTPLPRPDTAIVKGPKGEVRARRVTFRFRSVPTGTGFQCRLDKRPFKPCASPKIYKNLAPGRHKFRVRAVDSTGQRDPIAATRTFRVELTD